MYCVLYVRDGCNNLHPNILISDNDNNTEHKSNENNGDYDSKSNNYEIAIMNIIQTKIISITIMIIIMMIKTIKKLNMNKKLKIKKMRKNG